MLEDSADYKLKQELPRLAVVGDVSVEQSTGGQLLLHRLLCDYPIDRLLVIEGNLACADPRLRLPGVHYKRLSYMPRRLVNTRFGKVTHLLTCAILPIVARGIVKRLRAFRPEAILSVSHGHLWLGAALAARWLRIPFYLICHDDWGTITPFPHGFRWLSDRLFGLGFRWARRRLCVSHGMADIYRSEFGVEADVLLPSRGSDSPTPQVRVRLQREREGPVVAYAGSLFCCDYREQLAVLATALAELGGRLDLYTPQELGQLAALSNVRRVGFLPPES